ncbi:MAG: nucleoid-associated protein [Bacteroidales bacterium]|jgi:hypothetical protein|nr:nucleoid-associated protein [Bacteroidales bacterium]
MLYTDEIGIHSLVLHKVGNKSQEEGIRLSNAPMQVDEAVQSLLLQYFLSPFKSEEYYNLTHESDINLNEVYNYVSQIFDHPETFYEQSVSIARHLYEESTHPKIKSGELYVVHLLNCVVDGEEVDAVGLFKSESKETFLKVYPTSDSFEIEYEDGININKLDKGCLIFNSERENGYLVSVVDNLRQTGEAMYWRDSFLNIARRNDNFHQTEQCLDMCKQFVVERLPESFNVDKIDQADILNKSVQFFRENDEFSFDDFASQVIQQPEVIESFKQYKEEYEEDRDVKIEEEFAISDPAVKKQAKVFKSVIKLDKNFHIYVHGNRQLIEKGYDDDRDMRYYKIFFREEQ